MKKKTLIIAEAGVNHNGDMQLAKKLVDAAAAAGADYVKFQTFILDDQVTKTAKTATYQKLSSGDSQYAMLKKLEFPLESFRELKHYAEQKDIGFLSTGFDVKSLRFLMSLGMDRIKIPSGEITHLELLKAVAEYKVPLILSTGMSTLGDIEAALDVLLRTRTRDEITLLHCTSEYPAPLNGIHLSAMRTLENAFQTHIGYSDHTLGIEVPIAAVALGARVIEKHFTLDRTLSGPDHTASLEPDQLKAMVEGIRNIEQALGSPIKTVTAGEEAVKKVARKSLVAKIEIQKGALFTEDNVIAKRPGLGMSPLYHDLLIGKTATQNYAPDDFIQEFLHDESVCKESSL